MKKLISLLLVLVLLACAGLCEENQTVTVTIVNGGIVLAAAEVELCDKDGDGVTTINDALISAHEQYFELGAEGYLSEETEYGLSLVMLWSVDNGGAFGYYLNDASPMSLKDEVRAGDRVNAFVYTDLVTWSDTYCWFENTENEGEYVLFTAGWDENYLPVTNPCAGAAIVVDGVVTELVTDENGLFVLPADGDKHIVSAVSEEMNLVAPVLVIG